MFPCGRLPRRNYHNYFDIAGVSDFPIFYRFAFLRFQSAGRWLCILNFAGVYCFVIFCIYPALYIYFVFVFRPLRTETKTYYIYYIYYIPPIIRGKMCDKRQLYGERCATIRGKMCDKLKNTSFYVRKKTPRKPAGRLILKWYVVKINTVIF